VNLARLEYGRGNVAGARHVLEQAAQAGVSDPRLQAMTAQLSRAQP
jgi:hypothetical protein